MGSQDEKPREYPANWFPQTIKANQKREREAVLDQLNQLPTETLIRIVDAGQQGVTEAKGGA
jgi:hypothetical protein